MGSLVSFLFKITIVVKVRFGEISSELQDRVNKVTDFPLLEEILKLAVTSNSLEEFQQYLEQVSQAFSE